MSDFEVVLLDNEAGGYVAIVPALPGCQTCGETLAEVMKNVREAIAIYLGTLTIKEKKNLPNHRFVGVHRVKDI
ncbi:MAG TPA: type II toxin-antitoxin system HicB family antitoxin [Candidatus Limnocylindrales bacterium]|nr:type II toxin-antitoxin system HicB family antitoxin [Candidatus Limnocylindrales bacterium]